MAAKQNMDGHLIRAGALFNFAEVVRRLGGDPTSILKKIDLDASVLVEPNLRIGCNKVFRALELAALETGSDDFGLRLGQKHGIATLGPIGMLAREQASVGEVIKTLIDYLYLHNSAVNLNLYTDSKVAVLAIDLRTSQGVPTQQGNQLMVATTVAILRGFLGTQWNPLGVRFTHAAPKHLDFHRSYLKCGIEFNQALTSVTIANEDLRQPVSSSNPEFQHFARQWVDTLADQTKSEKSMTEDIRLLIPLLLSSGKCSADRLAEYLRVDLRTMQRKLQRSGTCLSDLINAVRRELAETSVADSRRSLSDIADMLGFAHLSGFSRWFSVEFGVSPSRWRSEKSKDNAT